MYVAEMSLWCKGIINVLLIVFHLLDGNNKLINILLYL
ncbi:hypothetical protein M6B38_311865 [Iris pallida]|uniref:Uncharacterized protein n=1 Tax=Iris pallida TaxID=29817 RepID=A0AAX6HFN9_IRIPA|nr:hypothetical protein M6B38_364100 [Iris pallida]KAJ6839859.1 hypothetical protein M6B38_311865 [Iris pallida]